MVWELLIYIVYYIFVICSKIIIIIIKSANWKNCVKSHNAANNRCSVKKINQYNKKKNCKYLFR